MDVRTIVAHRWTSIVLSFGSIIYAIYLLTHPFVLTYKPEYHLVSLLFSNAFFASYFLLFGILKLIGIAFYLRKTKGVALTCLNAGWALLTVAFFLQNYNGIQNDNWILTAIIFFVGLGVAFWSIPIT